MHLGDNAHCGRHAHATSVVPLVSRVTVHANYAVRGHVHGVEGCSASCAFLTERARHKRELDGHRDAPGPARNAAPEVGSQFGALALLVLHAFDGFS